MTKLLIKDSQVLSKISFKNSKVGEHIHQYRYILKLERQNLIWKTKKQKPSTFDQLQSTRKTSLRDSEKLLLSAKNESFRFHMFCGKKAHLDAEGAKI